MLRLIRRYKEERQWARQSARDLVATHGHDARHIIRQRMVERTHRRANTSLESLVKREIDKLLDIDPHVDTATRYTDNHR